jgi:HK97 family phage portal protein
MISRDQARRNSAWWAAQRLRADLISTMPVDIFRRAAGVQVEQKKPPLFINPEGGTSLWCDWMYSTTIDLDSVGNTFGIIRARDGLQLPSMIELVPYEDVTVRRSKKGVVDYRIGRTTYTANEIWHERQHTISGSPVGLSPTAYAAMSLNGSMSAAQFALDWFGNSTVPASHLKNIEKTIDPAKADAIKARFKAAVSAGDVFVTGKDWEYNMLSAKGNEAQFIETMKFGATEAARYLGVPGDMIDVPTDGSAITYANITQRNLQLFIINIGPAIARREAAFSTRLLPQPRYAKLNPGALLRMDLAGRYAAYKVGIDARFQTVDEVRDLEDLPPLTPDQVAQFAALFPNKATQPTAPQGGTP